MKIRKAIKKDILSILKISKENLGANLSEKERVNSGFITYEPNKFDLEDLIKKELVIIAELNKKIIGYLIFMEKEYAREHKFFKDFYKYSQNLDFNKSKIKNINYLIAAQDAVRKEFKRKGVLTKMFNYAKEILNKEYSVFIGEINEKNLVSLYAHRKIGNFKEIGEYKLNGQIWKVVATNIKNIK